MVVPIRVCAGHRCSEGAVGGRSRAVIAASAARALLVSSVASTLVVTPAEAGGKVSRAEFGGLDRSRPEIRHRLCWRW